MNYTSGTTGNPKGVYRPLSGASPEDAALGLSGILFLFGIQPHDDNVHIVGSPLYHTAVLRFSGASIHLGHTIVLMDKWVPEEMLALIERYRVTTSHMVPTQFHRLLALPEDVRSKYDMSSLQHMIHTAAPCPVDVKYKMIEWWGNAIDEYYAASEGGGTLVTRRAVAREAGHRRHAMADLGDRHLRRRRKSHRGAERHRHRLHVHADRWTSRTTRTRRRRRRTESEASSRSATSGCIDEDGYLFLRDRKIDMIISGGANIYPAEIENVLLGFPKVADVAVFGIPHDDWGEEVKAVVEPAEGVEPSDELAVRDHRVLLDSPGQVQDAEVDRLHRLDAPRPQRQALQAKAARSLLGGAGEDLTASRTPDRKAGVARSERRELLRIDRGALVDGTLHVGCGTTPSRLDPDRLADDRVVARSVSLGDADELDRLGPR